MKIPFIDNNSKGFQEMRVKHEERCVVKNGRKGKDNWFERSSNDFEWNI